MKPDWTEKDIDRYGGMTLRDVVDICEQLRVDNDRLNRNETLYRANINALEDQVLELKHALAAKEAMALELVKQRNAAMDDLAEARVEIRIAKKLAKGGKQ